MRLLALPLDVRNEDERYAFFSEGLGPELAERLEFAGAPLVPEHEMNRLLDASSIDSPEALSLASQRWLAQRAGARALLTGAVAGDADAVRVSLRLLLAGEPVTLARIEEKVAWSQLPEFLERATGVLGAALLVPAAATPEHGVSAGALELYLRARGDLSGDTRISYLKTCLTMAPDFARARLRLADELLEQRKADAAAEVLAPLGEGGGAQAGRIALLRARIEFLSGRTGAAEKWALASLQHSGTPAAHLLLGKIRLAIGDYGAAMREAEAALTLAPADTAALRLRDKAAASLPRPASAASGPLLSPAPPPGMTGVAGPKR
jgi:tetratricopeptide (TPR) repeat protein